MNPLEAAESTAVGIMRWRAAEELRCWLSVNRRELRSQRASERAYRLPPTTSGMWARAAERERRAESAARVVAALRAQALELEVALAQLEAS